MKIIVMKFGGSSLADPEKMSVMAERAAAARKKGLAVVMTVSAPADVTDDLLALSSHLTPHTEPRECDALLSAGEQISASLMAMAISGLGAKAISLTGAQAGIRTNSRHGDADIIAVRPARLIQELKRGNIAVVAGFQGINGNGNTTTLGRGGSDFTAVALARALKAGICELYTDVKGVYTANPTIVPQARKLERISYDAVMELARSGTEVRQLRAIAYAKKHHVPLRLRSAFETDDQGTLVGDFARSGVKPSVTCFSLRKTGGASEIHIIGYRLASAAVKRTVRSAAGEGGHVITRGSYSPEKITLLCSFRDGEQLLKALHKVFI